jgi:hypothetical protein
MSSSSHTNLKNVLNSLTAVAKNLEFKIKQAESSSDKIDEIHVSKKIITSFGFRKAMEREKREPDKSLGQIPGAMGSSQSNSHTNLKNVLNSLTAVAKNLEFKIKEAESSSDKIGQILVSKKIIKVSDLSAAMERKKREPTKYLGQILCEMGLPQSKIIKGIHYSNKRKQLGQVLVELNIITAAQLHDNLLQQTHLKNRGMHTPIGTLLVNNRIISEEHYINSLSAHFSMPIVLLKDYEVNPSLQKVIGEKYALKSRIVVLSNSPTKVTVATAEPHLSVLENLEKALPKGKHFMFYLARASEIEACLDKKYNPYKYTQFKL